MQLLKVTTLDIRQKVDPKTGDVVDVVGETSTLINSANLVSITDGFFLCNNIKEPSVRIEMVNSKYYYIRESQSQLLEQITG